MHNESSSSPPASPSVRPPTTTNASSSRASGCQVPFVPAGGGSSFTRFKQLSTRRQHPSRPPRSSPRPQQRTVSSPSLTLETTTQSPPTLPALPMAFNNNPPVSTTTIGGSSPYKLAPFSTPQWGVVDEPEDHPGRRKASGFLQPIKHLSGIINNSCIFGSSGDGRGNDLHPHFRMQMVDIEQRRTLRRATMKNPPSVPSP